MDVDGEVLDWGAEEDDHYGESHLHFIFIFVLIN